MADVVADTVPELLTDPLGVDDTVGLLEAVFDGDHEAVGV